MPDILHRFPVKASPGKVFEVFTSPAGLNSWWTLRCTGIPSLGAEYNFYFSDEYDWLALVEQMEQNAMLEWRFTRAMEDWMNTRVGFILSGERDLTQVLFYHKGWKTANDHYAITNYCWGQLLNGLKMFVEEGVVIPFAKRN